MAYLSPYQRTGLASSAEASGKIMTTMIIGLALIESLAIYTLVIIFIKA